MSSGRPLRSGALLAEWLCRGRERGLLAWFSWHLSYASGQVSPKHFEEYARQVHKTSALRAGIEYCAAVWQDGRDNALRKALPITVLALALDGEASSGPELGRIWSAVLPNMRTVVIPHAGHGLGDENPAAVAAALIAFFAEA